MNILVAKVDCNHFCCLFRDGRIDVRRAMDSATIIYHSNNNVMNPT